MKLDASTQKVTAGLKALPGIQTVAAMPSKASVTASLDKSCKRASTRKIVGK